MTKDKLRLLERLVRGEKEEPKKSDPNSYSKAKDDDEETKDTVIETETARGEV